MEAQPRPSYDDTAVAFEYKSDAALRKANFIFSVVNHPWVSAAATSLVKLALKMHLPVETLIRKTAFEHFCGGESIERSRPVIDQLARYNVQTILDYSVEGEKTEAGFDKTLGETLRTIDEAKAAPHIPFAVFKVTGLASFDLLEKVQQRLALTLDEKNAFERVRMRVHSICEAGFKNNVPVLIDAEETWIQDTIDNLAYDMMEIFNRERAMIFNTYQMYRTESLDNLKRAVQAGAMKGHHVGAKLVRGAYMEKERERAQEKNYPSPIHSDKEGTDNAFNSALLFCIENINRVSVMCGSHNEYSNHFLTVMMEQHRIAKDDPRVWFAQLYGMSDNISFNLARQGYNVCKYVPYGPVRSVMPYLLRRAEENTSVAGQSSRELTLIRKELQRRRKEHNAGVR